MLVSPDNTRAIASMSVVWPDATIRRAGDGTLIYSTGTPVTAADTGIVTTLARAIAP